MQSCSFTSVISKLSRTLTGLSPGSPLATASTAPLPVRPDVGAAGATCRSPSSTFSADQESGPVTKSPDEVFALESRDDSQVTWSPLVRLGVAVLSASLADILQQNFRQHTQVLLPHAHLADTLKR